MDRSVIEEALGLNQEVIWVMNFETQECFNYTEATIRTKYGIQKNTSPDIFWMGNIHPGDAGQIIDDFQKALQDNTVSVLEQEYRFLGPDGYCYFIRNKMRFSRHADGKTEKVTGVWTDITDHKKELHILQAEFNQVKQQFLYNLKEFSEREQILNQSQQLARIGSWEFDLESSTMAWSDEMYNIFRIDHSYEINDLDKLPGLFTPEYALSIRNVVQKIPLSENLPLDVSVRLNSFSDDYPRWVRITASADAEEGKLKRIVGLVYDITFFKEAEEKLRKSEEKFSKAFNLNPGLMLIVRERDQIITDVNSKIEGITGYRSGEVIGKTSLEIDIWVNRKDREVYQSTLQDFGAVAMETSFQKKNGEVFFVSVSAHRLLFSGEVHHLVVVYDITEKKRTEDKIRLSEARLNSIINNTDLQVWSVDTRYQIEALNNVFRATTKELFGIDVQAGMNALDIITQENDDSMTALLRELYDRAFSGEIVTHETFIQGRYFYSCVHPIISNGRVVGASAYSRDITEQRLADEKIRLNEANLAAMINNTSLFIWSVDREYRLITFNKQLEHFVKTKFNLGLEVGNRIIGTEDPERYTISEPWRERYNRALTGEVVKITAEEYGGVFNYSLSPIIEQKKVTGVSIFAEDVTEKVQQEAALADATRKVGEYKLMALRSVMNPHFIFNALNSIQSFITVNDQVNALNYLSTFSKLMRSILSNSVQNRIRLSEELEQLKHYVCLEQLRFDDSFDFVMEADPELDLEEIEIPSLLLQPYIENAILHGLYNKDSRGTLKLSIRREHESVLFEIEDDGVGREEAMKLRHQSLPRHKSMGTALTQERLKLINTDGKISLETTDLIEEGRAIGTRVNIRVNAAVPSVSVT